MTLMSHFWLPRPIHNPQPMEEFIVLVTNLEAVALRFRVDFTASQPAGAGTAPDCTAFLNERVWPLPLTNDDDAPPLVPRWRRSGRTYQLSYVVDIAPGETSRSGIAIAYPDTNTSTFQAIYEPGDFLRGTWSLSLPALPINPRGPVTGPSKAQLGHPARVAVSALRRVEVLGPNGLATHHETTPFPLFAGSGALSIPADSGTAGGSGKPGPGASPKRVAATRRASGRRR